MSRLFPDLDGIKCPVCRKEINITLDQTKIECPSCRNDIFVLSYPVEEIVLMTTDERPSRLEEDPKTRKRREKRSNRYMYGKFHNDTSEFGRELTELLETHAGRYQAEHGRDDLINEHVDLRNRIIRLLYSWIGQKKLESKLGIKIPLSASLMTDPPPDENNIRNSSHLEIYTPCEICGEDRITNASHILPRSHGGGGSPQNLLYLCPTHHHLFDHHRLSEEEWAKIDLSKKEVLPGFSWVIR